MANPWEVQYDNATAGNPWDAFQNDKPVPAITNNDGTQEKIFLQETGETLNAEAGTSELLSVAQNQSFDSLPDIGIAEETAATFGKMNANMALLFTTRGLITPEQSAVFIAEKNREFAQAQARQPAYVGEFWENWRAAGPFGKVAVAVSDPRAIGRATITNTPHAILPLMTTWMGTKTGAVLGAKAGATTAVVAGQMGPQAVAPEEVVTVPAFSAIGAAIGGTGGGAGGAFVGTQMSGAAETLDEILIKEYNVDMSNAESILNVFADPEAMADIRVRAEQAGADMAKVDALFQVFGAGFLKTMSRTAGPVAKVGAATADVATQATGEALGEAARQYSAFEEVDWDEAVFEGVTSLGQSAGQTAIAATTRVAQTGTQAVSQAARAQTEAIVAEVDQSLNEAVETVDNIDVETATVEEIDQAAEQFDITEAERDQIAAIGENQIIMLERAEQAEIVAEAQSLKDQIDAIPDVDRSRPATFKEALGRTPESITQFIKKRGGIVDQDGELRTRGIDGRSLVGLVRKEGRTDMDGLREALFDAGFFAERTDYNEISDSDIFDAIQQDVEGNKVFRTEDELEIGPLVEQSEAIGDFVRRGIDRGMSVEEITNVLREERGLAPFSTTPLNKIEPIVAEGAITKEYKNDVQTMTENRLGRMVGMNIPFFYDRRRKRIQSNGRNFIRDFATGIEKAISPISTRVKNISPELFVRLRKFEFEMKRDIVRNNKQLEPFLAALKTFTNEDFTAMDFALKNANEEVINQLAAKYEIQAELQEVRDMLDDVFVRANNVGMDVNYRSTFFPRRISDIDGLMDYLRGTNAFNVVQEAIKARSERLGRQLTEAERSAVVNNLFRGFTVENISLSKRGIFKERTIEEVNADIDQFYETTDQALIKYVMSANEAIAASELFGKGIGIDDASAIDNSIGALVDDISQRRDLSSRDAKILRDILGARFNEKTMGYIAGAFRNLTYIDVMGSPLNALTQIGDLTTSAYNAGILNAVREVPRSFTESGPIQLDDIGIDRIAQEFDSTSFTSKAVDNVFRATGLQKIDRVGKLNVVNSTFKDQQRLAKKGDEKLLAKLDLMFGPNAAQVRQDLIDGNITDDVKFLAFNTLLDMQPVAQLEMPEYYLRAGNLKLLYMLKTFTIKQLDIYRREVVSEFQQAYVTGNKKQAAKALGNFARLFGFWMVLGASADYMKDLLRSLFGDDEIDEPEDYLIDNALKAFGFSKYQANMVAKKGPTEVFFDIFRPPTKFIDNVVKDYKRIEKDGDLTLENTRAIRSVPVGGELYYFWFGAGSGGANTGSSRDDL